jgi:hypothetical protein
MAAVKLPEQCMVKGNLVSRYEAEPRRCTSTPLSPEQYLDSVLALVVNQLEGSVR